MAWVRAERGTLSALVVQISTGRELAQAAPESALDPASNQKVLTAAAALDRLGPDFRFTTLLAGRPGSSGLEIALRSDGDPELSSAELGAFADTLVERGVTHVQSLSVDQSAFDTNYDPPGYERRPEDSAAYRAPISAVAVDRNAVTLFVLPDTGDGPARVWFEPSGLVTSTQGVIKTIERGAQRIGLNVRATGTTLEATVSGTVLRGRSALSFSRRIPNPELVAGYSLRAKLEKRGIKVGAVGSGGTAIVDPLVVHRSRPLAELLYALGKRSDNFAAEMLFKALGAKATNAVGTAAAGAQAVEAYLRRINAWSDATRVLNGSGLYADNRVSARTLCRVLSTAYLDPRIGPELVSSFAIGGVDGTLSNRFTSERATRRVRAKTGTLADVAALSGYVLAPAPLGPVAFSFLVNGIPGKVGEARRHMDAVVSAITR